ncbi:MAG: CehA/McbA family metallohydrolase [Myxococcota bacterium]
MTHRLAGCIALHLLAAPAVQAEVPLRAERLDATNLEALRPGGSDALGGLGDYALSNGTLCAVVASPEHETELSTRGGALLDLGHCGRGDDQLVLLHPLVNLEQDGAIEIREVYPERTADAASLVSVGERDGLQLEIRYSVDAEDPARLRIVIRLERVAEGPRAFALAQVLLFGERSMRPFAIVSEDLPASPGFQYPPFDLSDRFSLLRAIGRADVHVLVGAAALDPPSSYGHRLLSARLERAEGGCAALPGLSMAAEGFAAVASFSRPFWLGGQGDLGLLELAQTLFMDLERGDALVQESELRMGRGRDAGFVTDRLFAEGTRVIGRIDDPAAALHVELASGGAVAFVRPAADGSFELRLPPGRYRLRARGAGGRETGRELVVGDAAQVEVPELRLGPAAIVRLPRGEAMRLSFLYADGGGAPVLWDDLLGFRVGEELLPTSAMSGDVSLAGRPSDPQSVVLPPGRYRVLADRGPEYGVSETELVASPGETRSLVIAPPRRAVESPGWIAADLHVHAAPSDDSSLPLETRVASFVAEGAEVLVATDHDHVADYGPTVRELGLEASLATLVGVEISSSVRSQAVPYTSAHSNAFPIPHQPEAYRGGAPSNEGRRLREIVAGIRALGGERVVQLNHPRGASPGRIANSFFTHLGVAGEPFDPERPLTDPPNDVLIERDPKAAGLRDLDFDAIELMNGKSLARYRAVRADWFALLRQGEIRTATANSDTHRTTEIAALPRSYVRLADDRITAFDEARFVRAIRAGRVFGSSGPLLEVALGDVGIGERFVGREGPLRVEVRAAEWVPVSELRVFVDGVLEATRPIRSAGKFELPLSFLRDAFVTVEVEGPSEGIYADLYPGFTPFAFTNPIFVDADADGAWSPPGLP